MDILLYMYVNTYIECFTNLYAELKTSIGGWSTTYLLDTVTLLQTSNGSPIKNVGTENLSYQTVSLFSHMGEKMACERSVLWALTYT